MSLTCRPIVMLNKAISFFPALRVMGRINLKRGTVPFPEPVAENKNGGPFGKSGKIQDKDIRC